MNKFEQSLQLMDNAIATNNKHNIKQLISYLTENFPKPVGIELERKQFRSLSPNPELYGKITNNEVVESMYPFAIMIYLGGKGIINDDMLEFVGSRYMEL